MVFFKREIRINGVEIIREGRMEENFFGSKLYICRLKGFIFFN